MDSHLNAPLTFPWQGLMLRVMKKLLIFDFDGTLVDTAPGIHAAANDLMAHYKAPPLSLDQTKSFIGSGLEPLARHLFPDLDQNDAKLA